MSRAGSRAQRSCAAGGTTRTRNYATDDFGMTAAIAGLLLQSRERELWLLPALPESRKIGDHVLDPGWTMYGKRVLYSTYDITGQLRPGPNSLGVVLGNG